MQNANSLSILLRPTCAAPQPAAGLHTRARDALGYGSGLSGSQATIQKPYHGKAIGHDAPFAWTLRPVRVVVQVRRASSRLEFRVRREQGSIGRAAFFDVGLDEALATGHEQARRLNQPRLGDQQAFLVALLPPWIGEMYEDALHGSRTQAGQSEPRVLREDPAAVPFAQRAHSAVDERGPLPADLEGNDAALGRRAQPLEQKPAPAGADLQLHGRLTRADQMARVDDFRLRETRRVTVGKSSGHGRRFEY